MSQMKNESNDTATTTEATEQIFDDTLKLQTLQTPPTLTVATQLKRLAPCIEIPKILNSNAMIYATSSCQHAISSCQYGTSTCQCETSSVNAAFLSEISSSQYSQTPMIQVKDEDKADKSYFNNVFPTSKKRQYDIAFPPNQIADIADIILPGEPLIPLSDSQLQSYMQNITDAERNNSSFNMGQYFASNATKTPKEEEEEEVNVLTKEKHSLILSKDLNIEDDWCCKDNDGDTILHLLVAQDSEKTTEVLNKIPIGHQSINATNKLQQTPLHIAMCRCVNKEKSLEFIKQCLNRSDIDNSIKKADNDGNTPLQIGVLCEQHEKVKTLLEHGRKVDCMQRSRVYDVMNELNNDGLSAIHLASDNQDIQMILLLTKHGGDIDIKDGRSGKTILMRVLQYALENPIKKVDTLKFATELIEKLKVNVSAECYGGNTALHYACLLNDKNMVSLLLNKGSDVGLKNHNKKTEKDLTTDEEIKNILEKKLRKRRRSRKKEDSTSSND